MGNYFLVQEGGTAALKSLVPHRYKRMVRRHDITYAYLFACVTYRTSREEKDVHICPLFPQ